MFGLLQRPKLTARFTASEAASDEFARQIRLVGRLHVANDGSAAEISGTEMIVIAGFRRIPLAVPGEWRAFQLGHGAAREGDLEWSLTLDAPLRAQAGQLYVALQDQKHKKWEWRLPFTFELR